MKDVELIIRLSEKNYEHIKKLGALWVESEQGLSTVTKALLEGILLPMNHGKLKDIGKFIERVQADRKHACYLKSWSADDVLDYLASDSYAPIVIEASVQGDK